MVLLGAFLSTWNKNNDSGFQDFVRHSQIKAEHPSRTRRGSFTTEIISRHSSATSETGSQKIKCAKIIKNLCGATYESSLGDWKVKFLDLKLNYQKVKQILILAFSSSQAPKYYSWEFNFAMGPSPKPWRDYSIHRVPECLSPRRNWVPPPHPPQASVSPPLDPKGREVSGCGGPNSDDWKESLALCILCSLNQENWARKWMFKTKSLGS